MSVPTAPDQQGQEGRGLPGCSGPSLRMEPHCPLGPLPLQAVLSDRSLGEHAKADGPL